MPRQELVGSHNASATLPKILKSQWTSTSNIKRRTIESTFCFQKFYKASGSSTCIFVKVTKESTFEKVPLHGPGKVTIESTFENVHPRGLAREGVSAHGVSTVEGALHHELVSESTRPSADEVTSVEALLLGNGHLSPPHSVVSNDNDNNNDDDYIML